MRLPTEIKKLRGTLQPCHTNPNEPQPTEPFGDPPSDFLPAEKKAWRELKRMCVPGVLTISDRFIAEVLCQLMARLRQRDPPLTSAERSNLTYCLSHLGLTPVDRARVNAKPVKTDDDDGIGQFVN